jgi:hypothetical protein
LHVKVFGAQLSDSRSAAQVVLQNKMRSPVVFAAVRNAKNQFRQLVPRF